SHPKATPMRPQSHTRATLKPGECGPTARRRGCAKAATLKGRAELSAKLAFGLTALPPTLAAQAQPVVPARIDARMMRQPAVSVTQIAFVYAGDIWLVDKSGGVA